MTVGTDRYRILNRILSAVRKADLVMNFQVGRSVPCPAERCFALASLASTTGAI